MRLESIPTTALLVAIGLAATLVALLLARGQGPARSEIGEVRRVVSLSPAITETLFHIGAGGRVVGVSDECLHPPAATRRPRLGTALRPRFEALAELAPDLILTAELRAPPGDALQGLAPTVSLPWTTLPDVLASMRRLGLLLDRPEAAKKLAATIADAFAASPPAGAQRVLMVLGHPPGALNEVWFIKRNSLHGTLLEAAGARNAVNETVSGPPIMSLEHALEIDPDGILILLPRDDVTQETRRQLIADWQKLHTLGAVKRDAIRVIAGSEIYIPGPRILEVLEEVGQAVREIDPDRGAVLHRRGAETQTRGEKPPWRRCVLARDIVRNKASSPVSSCPSCSS